MMKRMYFKESQFLDAVAFADRMKSNPRARNVRFQLNGTNGYVVVWEQLPKKRR